MHDDVTLPFADGQQGKEPREPADVPAVRDAWGSFRLLARVGYGGFGEVYRAWDPHLEREVALKLLLPRGSGKAQSDDEYKSMLREARALASVRHPNIVPVYGIDRHDGRVGFWTDFVKGKTLSVLVGAQGPFGDREATLIGLDVTRALGAVHRAGILHRDIKAENVMREEGGRILLMDFGLSTLPVGQTDIAGSPNYMAPELWQGMAASVESDIFSMGVLLYFLVTGEHPANLGGLTTRNATEAIANRRPLMDLRSDLPEPFLRTVSKAMESDPAKRFLSAGQLAAALAECLGTGVPVEITPVPTLSKTAARLRWLVPAAVAALLLGAVTFKTPVVQQWLHLGSVPVAAGISSNTNEQYVKAQELLKKSYKDANVAEAVGIFQQILKENSEFALAEAGLGSAYFAQYRNSDDKKVLDLAKEATDKALNMQADLAPALATRSQMEAKAGETQLALQDAEKATQSDPRSAEAFASLAAAYDALGRNDEAIKQIENAIAIDDSNSMWPVRLGNYYEDVGKLKEAAGQWQKAVDIDPQNSFAYYDLGIANLRFDKLPEARQDIQKALQLDPDASSYGTLGTIFAFEGNFPSSIEMLRKAIALDPTSYQSWANLGSAMRWSGGKREDSVQAFEKAISLAEEERLRTPADPLLLARLADYYASVGDGQKSAPLARKALVLAPIDPDVLYTLGDTYELLGQRPMAIQLISKALAKGFRLNEFQRTPDLASLRNDPAFKIALTKATEKSEVDSARKMN